MTGTDRVLLAARVNEFDVHTTWGSQAAKRRLVEAGDHVEWHDAGHVQVWRLPDQPAEDLPTLTRVVFARAAAVIVDSGLEVSETHVLLVGKDGRTLAPLAVAGAAHTRMSEAELEKLWPRAAFDQLAARGVLVEDVAARDVGELRRRFPGSVARSRVMMYSRRTYLTYVALVGTALVAAYLLTRG